MKRLVLLLLVWVAAAISAAADSQEDAFLGATRLRESKDQDWMTGQFGERGSYQFRRSTWRLHTRASFDLAYNREVADSVAHRHYQWLVKTLQRNGIPATAYNIACAWNGGAGNVARGTVSGAAREYAECVNNLTVETLRRQVRAPKPKPFVIKLESYVSDGTNVRVNLATRPAQTPVFELWRPENDTPVAYAQQPARVARALDAFPDTRAIGADASIVALILVPSKG